MSVVHAITGLDYLEQGLKNLKGSKMMAVREFKDMFSAMECHYRDFRLSHLTGKTSDLMEQAQRDTKFYNILVKMLCEIKQDRAKQQQAGLSKVYDWYLANKHVLHSGPRFGKKFHRKEAQDILNKSVTSPRQTSEVHHIHAQKQNDIISEGHRDMNDASNDNDMPSDFSDTEIDIEFKSAKDDVDDDDTSRMDSQMLGSEYKASSVKTTPVVQSDFDWKGGRKMVHSVASIVNPHANPALTLDPAQDPGLMSPGQQNAARSLVVKKKKSQKGVIEASVKHTPLQTQDVGARSVSVCEDRLSHPVQISVVLCKGCNSNKYMEMAKSGSESRNLQRPVETKDIPEQGKPLHEQSLEEFYRTTEILYPLGAGNRSASRKTHSSKSLRKSKSAPHYREKNSCDRSRRLSRQSEDPNRLGRQLQSSKTPVDKEGKTDIKMDMLVSMIDSVSHEMVVNRDPWSGNLLRGLSQRSARPIRSISPPARTNTPIFGVVEQQTRNVDQAHQEPHSDKGTWTLSKYRPTETISPSPRLNTQQQDSPQIQDASSTSRSKRSKTRLGKSSYSKNVQRQSLRSAGGSQSSLQQRPRTAPVFHQNKFDKKFNKSTQDGSNETSTKDHKSLESAIHVKHLIGTSKGDSDMDYEFDEEFIRAMRHLSRSVSETQPPLEYVCFVTSTQGNKAPERSNDNIKTQGQINYPYSSLHQIVSKVSSVDLADTVSSRADNLDQQDLGELDDELRDLCEEDDEQGDDKVNENLPGEQVKTQLEKNKNTFDVTAQVSAIDLSVIPADTSTQGGDWDFLPAKVGDGILGVLLEHDVVPYNDENCNFGQDKLNDSANYTDVNELAMSTAVHQPCSSEKWKLSPKKTDGFKSRTVLKNIMPAGKPQLDMTTAEVKYHRILKGKPNASRLRSQSARVLGSHGKLLSRPEDLFLDFTPKITTRMERAAGRVPGTVPSSTAAQVLRMTRRQNEYFKRAPPMRTPPSIPSPHSLFGSRQSRSDMLFNPELEHHARKEIKPLQYMQHVQELCRSDGLRSAPPRLPQNEKQLEPFLQICRLPSRSQTFVETPSTIHDEEFSPDFTLKIKNSLLEESSDSEASTSGHGAVADRQLSCVSPAKQSPRLDIRPYSPSGQQQCLSHLGRPIAQYQHISDPDELTKAVETQQKAAAAVDIQRIFRGYVARGQYKKLLSEERKRLEEERRAAVEIQRAYREHLERKSVIQQRGLNQDMVTWSQDYKTLRDEKEQERQEKLNEVAKKVWHPKVTGPTKRELYLITVEIQRHVRGWLVRKTLEKLKRKAVWNGSTFSKMVREYKNMLIRVQKQHGKDRVKTPFTFKEFDNYLDLRRRYEGVFERKAFGGELDISELEEFFHESDLHPSVAEIDEAVDVVFRGQGMKKGRGLKKKEVLDLIFYIYVPKATDLHDTRISTWMNPIIDGVEARKLLGSELVEKAPLSVCMQLVIDSKRERREREAEAKRKKREEEAAAASQLEEELTKESEPTQTETLKKPENGILKGQKASKEEDSKQQRDGKDQKNGKKVNEKQKQVKIVDNKAIHNIPS
ncbi:uncharacterized protein LOC121374330 isoform X2 [Gigantopelta aegis]|uniref:uncharacterized protein LOC121374330 isoform X2 n=1 Tax=Gigantopelta aegis TaxID=1735272 RepID=UPI001B88DC21|nr:uncharacterized protein LOC121374330 isoform X2 [Gigantopelta aegis]